jgi:tripartite-type tricarboxylate transporter receptor subunit TctC
MRGSSPRMTQIIALRTEPAMASRQRFNNAITAALGGALLLLPGAPASAQDAGSYPNRPVMMIVPFAPGGASDFVARIIQNGVSEILGQQIVVDNRPGAAGIIGTEVAARAAPDGYTTFLGNIGTLSISASVYSNMRIKPDQDLAPVRRFLLSGVHPNCYNASSQIKRQA